MLELRNSRHGVLLNSCGCCGRILFAVHDVSQRGLDGIEHCAHLRDDRHRNAVNQRSGGHAEDWIVLDLRVVGGSRVGRNVAEGSDMTFSLACEMNRRKILAALSLSPVAYALTEYPREAV